MTSVHQLLPGMFQHWEPIRTPPSPSPAETGRRATLWRASGGKCGICGRKIKSLLAVTTDHVVPRARGGKNSGNRVPAHKGCNARKADRLPTGCERLWLAVVNARLAP